MAKNVPNVPQGIQIGAHGGPSLISGETVNKLFRRVPLFADLKPTDRPLASCDVANLVQCARQCSNFAACFGFFYDKNASLCSVYDVSFNTLSFKQQDGIKAYTLLSGVTSDCYDVMMNGGATNGLYAILPRDNGPPINVSCENNSINGGWLVIQRRTDGSESFNRTWNDYRDGFGDLNNEFWLGNTNIYRITNQGHYDLRIDLEDFDGSTRYALFNNFYLASEEDHFRLQIGTYTGTAGDGLSYHNGYNFSTYDRDSDTAPSSNCAQVCKGAWWYGNCHLANLNGLYLKGNHSDHTDGMSWTPWKGPYYSLKKSVMKIRPSPRIV
ncbi:microfibril-associated glycoprotein 4-like [Gigantopelta aegis]|uniref:microfibril-associated glycoprotein 4-like n=1 Tax=Gigantopelta aegis TaxID=1735272 RepID=UPI001B887C46|nr:microfibril-associated glycoprotein 4-like [Gigantopelta aegis]